jgi:hypothetical protein
VQHLRHDPQPRLGLARNGHDLRCAARRLETTKPKAWRTYP